MQLNLLILSALLIFIICSCAAHPEPIIDTQGINMARYEDDMADCAGYGEQIRIERGAVKGAAAGEAGVTAY